MRYRVCTLFVSIMVLSACGKKEPAQPDVVAAPIAAAAAPAPAPVAAPDEGDEPAPAPEAEPVAEPGGEAEPAAPDEPVAEPAAEPSGALMDPSRCAALIARELALIRDSGTDEMRTSAAARTEEELVATCASAPVPAAYEQCVSQVATASDIYRTCVAAVFQGRDLTVGRTFKALEDNSGAEPPALEVDGDTMSFGTCRMIHQKVGNFRAFFVDCPGKATLGPLTTGDDIKASIAALREESANAHATVLGIMNNYPRGGGRWRVCQNGQCRIE